jgi:hypothetical protein
MSIPAAVHDPALLSNSALCEQLEHLEREEQEISATRRAVHAQIDGLPDGVPERVLLTHRERELSEHRLDLHRQITELRQEQHRRLASLRAPVLQLAVLNPAPA